MTAARCGICGGTTRGSEERNRASGRRAPLFIEHVDGCAEAECRHTVGFPYVSKMGSFRLRLTGSLEVVGDRISVGFHRVRYVDLKTGPATILCSSIIDPPGFESLNDVPPDVEAVFDCDGTRWHRGPDRLDWWWPPWDEYAGDPQTADDVDGFSPFTIASLFDAGEG